VRPVASLHGRQIAVENGPEVRTALDADQFEQVLINLTKNAVEAVGEG
jgi:signal transduction histidine kinase